jgi:hypothetical protein
MSGSSLTMKVDITALFWIYISFVLVVKIDAILDDAVGTTPSQKMGVNIAVASGSVEVFFMLVNAELEI